ncbi:amino acid adenylation domain-containing protein, partial [Streptomyces sodiiphilus]|uniref:amino acid adenylation domain-containing protein n=1 Tax=Streptomyces sodiiphilus TaxID=226217 RepID=UPI0031D11F95
MSVNCYVIGGTRVLMQCTDRLVEAGIRVEGVLSDDPAVVAWAAERGMTVMDPHADLASVLSGQEFDYLFSIVNFRILPREVLELPAVAAINFHDGPLPRYSGSHVAAWALYEGAARHAATWHLMTEAVDAGSVLAERWFPVRDHSTALSLTFETAENGIELFGELLPHIAERSLPAPVNTGDRERRFYRRSARMASGGLIHAGTTAAEAERISKALDYGSFPNPLGIPALLTEQGAVFTQQVRRVPREDVRTGTTVVSVTASALTLAAPDADLVLSDFTAVDGSALSGRAAAQRLGLIPGAAMPAVSGERLAALTAAQGPLRAHEPWWRDRLEDLRPVALAAADFSAGAAHYGRYELAYAPRLPEESTDVVRAFLTAVGERAGGDAFDFAWSPASARALAEETHGLAASRFPVRFDADSTGSLRKKLEEAAARHGYATDLEVRLGLARRPPGSGAPGFTGVMVLERHPGEEASVDPDTEIALLCPSEGPPVVFVRETAMDEDEALEFAERVEDIALETMFLGGDAPAAEPPPSPVAAPETGTDPTVTELTGEGAPGATGRTVTDLVTASVAARPDAIAVRGDDGTLDYARLDAWADTVAARLHDQGVGTGSVVGVLTGRGRALIPAMLGILRTGAAFLPLDPDYPAERLSRCVEVSGCELLLTDARTHALGEALGPALQVPAPDGSALAVPPPVGPGDLAYVLFTSGSTGDPKGVEVEHGALANFLTGVGERLGSGPSDVMLAHTTVAFDISLLELLLPLTVGATVVMASREVARDPGRLAGLLPEVNVAQATPSMWRLLLGTGWRPHPELTVLSGGEALPPATARPLHASARALWNLYGPTEATIWTSAHPVESVEAFLPLGDALPGTALHVLDEDLRPCPAGSSGDLYVSGAGLARGYAGRPDLTDEVFVADPVTGIRLYRTGDTVRLHADGRIEWLGRADAQLKVRGNRIEPAEIERVLEEFEGVRAAVVTAVPFEDRGAPRLTAYLVADRTPAKSELDGFVGRTLPEYMVPDAYVPVDALPLTGNGKIDRSRLPRPTRDSIIRSSAPATGPAGTGATPPAPAAEPAPSSPQPVTPEPGPTGRTPETLTDSILRVFSGVLEQPSFQHGDNFFDLGGDSASATLAASELSRALGTEVSPSALFATGTPDRLAGLLAAEGTHSPEAPDAPDKDVERSRRPDPAAERLAATATDRPAGSAADGGRDDRIAVIGMACRFPGAATPDEFWANLAEGSTHVGAAPEGHRGWGHLWASGDELPTGWIEGVELFDAARFGLTDREARRLDPLQRLLLTVTDEALQSCGHDRASLGADTGVFVGTIASDFPRLVAGSIGHDDPHAATGTAVSMVANRLSHVFDWSGPSLAVDTACSSSLVALHQAATHLRTGDIDAAVVGAANLVLTPDKTRSFARNGMLSPQGVCRAFDDGADGYVRGEGCGVLLLKRLADAERDGDPVLAVVRGTAVNHTGSGAGFLTAPSRTAQEAVIRKALAVSGVAEDRIGYVEAHGTGTQLGDLIELEALGAALGTADKGSVAVGSVKTSIGHLEPAAGIAGLIKTILALQAGQIPPSAHLTVPNKAFRFEDSPLFVADRLLPWSGPRVAGVSSFGFGGANAHAVVEAAPAPRPVPAGTGPHLLTISAVSAEALHALAGRLVRLLGAPHCPPLPDLCLASRRLPAASHRLACVVDSIEQLDDKLRLFLAGVENTRSLHVGVVARERKAVVPPLGEAPGRDALGDAARRFAAGEGLPAEQGRAAVRFPTAPLGEKYLWLEPAEEGPASPPEDPVAASRPADGSERTWTEHPEAAEHLVLGHPTLPGSGYPGKAAELLGSDRFSLRDLTFRSAVRPPAVITGRCDGTSVVFRDGTGATVCDAALAGPAEPGASLAPPESEDGFTPVALEGMYRAFERDGLGYGPGFRVVDSLAIAPGEAVGTLTAPAGDGGPVDARLLDGAFQVALAACAADGLYVPFTIERLTVHRRLTGPVRVYARRERGGSPDAGLLTAALVVLDGAGPVLEARGVTWKRISPARPSPAAASGRTPTGAVPELPSATGVTSNGHRPPVPGGPGGPGGPGNDGPGLGRALARWVADALEIGVGDLETDSPLEAQGLDSMLAVSLAQDIRSKLDVDIPVTLVLETGTVDRLATELREVYGVTAPPAPAGQPPAPPDTAPAPAAGEETRPSSPALATSPGTAVTAATAPAPGPAPEPPEASGPGEDDRHDIAIVGLDGVFPGAGSPEELWRVLMDREDCLREVPKDRWDIDAYWSDGAEPGTVYLRRAGFVDDLTGFDAGFFQISPAEARWIDPQQRHLIQSAWRALEDAGLAGDSRDRSMGVFVGASYQHYRDQVVGDVVETAAGLGNHNAILANRV